MIEAALFALDLLVMVYACWVVIRASRHTQVKASDLGLFAYKENREEPRP